MPLIPQQRANDPIVSQGISATNGVLLHLAGIYPYPSGRLFWLCFTYAMIIYFGYLYYLPIFTATIYYSYMSGDIEMFGQGLCFGCYSFVYGFVAVFYLSITGEIDDIMAMVGSGLFTYSLTPTEEEIELQATEMRKSKQFSKRLLSLLLPVGTLQMGLVPIYYGFTGQYSSITNATSPINRFTPLPVWTPYEVNSGFTFWFTYVSQMFPGFIQYFIVAALASFFVAVCCNITGHLKRLKYSLLTIFDRAAILHLKRGGKPVTEVEAMDNDDFQKCCYDCLVDNIKHHKKIVECHSRFQSICQYAIFAIFAGAAIIVSTPVYTLMGLAEANVDPQRRYTATIVMTLHIGVSVSVLFSYCHFGQAVITEGEDILSNFYNMPWPDTNKSVRQLIDVAMSNSQVVLEFKAFLISLPASRETFLQIIRAAYTLFNILITLREK